MTATRPSGAPHGPEGTGTRPEAGPEGAKPPQGDTALRERLAEAAAEWAYSYPISANALGRTDDGAWKLARIWGEQITRIAVMPVMEAWAAEQTQRAEQAERDLAAMVRVGQAQNRHAGDVEWARHDAEAAVQRVRAIHHGGSAENTVLCVACCDLLPCPTLRALDRPEGT